jgi:hypothetical protein
VIDVGSRGSLMFQESWNIVCSIHGDERGNSGVHFGIFLVFIGAVLAEIFGVEVWHFANN